MKKFWMLALGILIVGGCTSGPPADPNNICRILADEKGWKKRRAQGSEALGSPTSSGFCFCASRIYFFRARAKPERKKLLGIVPTVRPSSAFGYAQATDAAWSDYKKATGRTFVRRDNMGDALDFIGWYNHTSNKRLGLSKSDAYSLYLAYYSGHGGYARGTWKRSAAIKGYAKKAARQAAIYKRQLRRCKI